jgi:bifunctional non-homologous end joining protein LigD
MSLETYQEKRDFKKTPEPRGKISKANKHRFVCQEHHASNLHFDLRLEIGGVLKSWSVRKGPSLDPSVRRLAVPTEDHPVEYLEFQGDIPEGNYGAGQHRIWDAGTYELLDGNSPEEQFEKGKLKIDLNGKKLKGTFNLFRLGHREQWLLVKGTDEFAENDWKLELLIPDKKGNKFIDNTEPSMWRRSGNRRPARESKTDQEVRKKPAKPKKGESLPGMNEVLKEKGLKGDVRVKVGKFAVQLTSLDRVYWPEEGYTKADLLRYYYEVADHILPYLKNRPIIMKRYPTGVRGISFHQHDVDEAPEYVRTVALLSEDGGPHRVDYIVCDNLETHLYLANFGAIERHPWHSRVNKLERPDWFVFDMDPGDKVEFETICDAALFTRDIITDLGLESYAKSSGSRGIHVYVPIKAKYTYEQVFELAKWIAARVAIENPKIATVERTKQKRTKSQVYVDYMQNAYGKSVAAPYSVRPKPGAPVSMPVEWREVEKRSFSIKDFTIKTALARIRKKGDIFKAVLNERQSLDAALKKAKVRAK